MQLLHSYLLLSSGGIVVVVAAVGVVAVVFGLDIGVNADASFLLILLEQNRVLIIHHNI